MSGIKHKYISGVADGGDASLVQPSNWNDEHQIVDLPVNPGPLAEPTFTDNGDGTVDFGGFDAFVFSTTDFSGELLKYTIAPTTLSFIDGTEEYAVVDYNGGIPILRKETNKVLVNGSSIFTIFVCWRQGTTVHSIGNDSYGYGLAGKTHRMLYNTESYRRSLDGGLILSESAVPNPRTIIVSPSVVYAGVTPIIVNPFDSSVHTMTQVNHVAGVWTYTHVVVYDNLSYDNGTNAVTMTDNRYSNRFLYRSVGDVREVFYTLGRQEFFNHDRCFDELPPEPPVILRDHCIYIGRVIIGKSATSGTAHPIFDHIEAEPEYTRYSSAGIWTSPTITTGANTVTVGLGEYILFTDGTYSHETLDKFIISGNTFTVAEDGLAHYIVAKYNTGAPVVVQIDNVAEINQADVIPILTVFNLAGQILYLFWDQFAKGLANKLCHRLVKTERFKVQPGGLILSEKTGRYVLISGGNVWYGATYSTLSDIDSSVVGNEIVMWYHVGGVLTRFTTTQYDNTYYDNGTDRVELNPNKYAVNWVYRGVSQLNNRPVILLGGGNYTLADAIASAPPAEIPAVTASFGMLVGRIIVLKGAGTATEIDTISDDYGLSIATVHNGLSGLQGGTLDEYYHLTAAEHADYVNKATKNFAIAMAIALG